MHRINQLLLSILIVTLVAACAEDKSYQTDRLVTAFREGNEGIWVGGTGVVTRIYSDDKVNGHQVQRFELRITDELAIILHYQPVEWQKIPVSLDQHVQFEGRYQWQPSGGIVKVGLNGDSDPVSWVEARGQRYQ